jgi:hypothetical protein
MVREDLAGELATRRRQSSSIRMDEIAGGDRRPDKVL